MLFRSSPYNTGAGWNPIGDDDDPFTGTFDGNGYSIRGLYINRPLEGDVGLFGVVEGPAVISNVKLLDVHVTGAGQVGGLVGQNFFGHITNCRVNGDVSAQALDGIPLGLRMGGLVGYNYSGTITASYAAGTVSGHSDVGGLVGENSYGSINRSYAVADAFGAMDVGGLVGLNRGTIQASYARGTADGEQHIGGLVGHNDFYSTIVNAYATGRVFGYAFVGGLVGTNSGSIVTSYYDSETTRRDDTGKGEPKSTAEMKQQATFAGWGFGDVWGIEAGVNDG